MILPQGTSLYRYCVAVGLPDAWDPTFENPEYANHPHGKKNQIGAYFFYELESMAKNVAGVALRDYGNDHQITDYTLTTCQTTRDLTLLDLSGNLPPCMFLEKLYDYDIDILTNDFVNYFKNQHPFSVCKDAFQRLRKYSPFLLNMYKLTPFDEEIFNCIHDFFCNDGHRITGQLVTDYENGHTFKSLLEQKGYEGYVFNEERECATICIFDASNLTLPIHTIIKGNSHEMPQS